MRLNRKKLHRPKKSFLVMDEGRTKDALEHALILSNVSNIFTSLGGSHLELSPFYLNYFLYQ